MLRRVAHLVEVQEARECLTTPTSACTRWHRRAARAKPRKRVGRGEGSGYGRTSGRGQKGAGSRSGNKRKAGYEGGQIPLHMRMRKLRGPHMKKSMPFEPFRTLQPARQPRGPEPLRGRRRGHARDAARARPRHAQGHPREDPRPRRAASARTSSCRRTPSARRRARRSRPPAVPARSWRRSSPGGAARHDRHDRQLLQRSRDPAEDPVHGRDPRALPPGRGGPGPGRRHRRRQERRGQLQRLQHPRLPEPVLRRRPAELRDLLAGHHALHHRVDHPAAADGRGARRSRSSRRRARSASRRSRSTRAT